LVIEVPRVVRLRCIGNSHLHQYESGASSAIVNAREFHQAAIIFALCVDTGKEAPEAENVALRMAAVNTSARRHD
jgi:hypothetical protein